MNGTTHTQRKPFKVLSQYLLTSNSDHEYWWRLTGKHVAALLEAAGYPIEEQYAALLFHFHWTVPYMGPAPRATGEPVEWKSLLSLDGTPSSIHGNGTPARATQTSDPLNQHALREELQRLAKAIPENNMNLSWVNHFFAQLYDHDYSKYTQAAAAGSRMSTATSVQLGVEFLRKGIGFKTYLFPRKLGLVEAIPRAQYETAINQLDTDGKDYSARAALCDFLDSSPEGKLLAPFSLAVDNVAPEKSRLKWYFHTLNTSFKSVREVMTLGGRITGIENQLEDLYKLIKATAGLPADFPEDEEVPLPRSSQTYQSSAKENFGELEKVLTGYLYYFDIAPGNKFPEIKWFIPVRHYGPDDLALAHAIMGWMEKRNRGAFCKKYLHMLEVLAEHRRLDDGKGLQTFVSCLFKSSGELDVTTYLGAEAFHLARLQKLARGTLRRGDY